jgi:hypothetical protein
VTCSAFVFDFFHSPSPPSAKQMSFAQQRVEYFTSLQIRGKSVSTATRQIYRRGDDCAALKNTQVTRSLCGAEPVKNQNLLADLKLEKIAIV